MTNLAAIPVYRRIEEHLRLRVQAREWPGGGMLPSRKRLAEEYGVGLPTLERAIRALVADGTLHADLGRGTFVPIERAPAADAVPGSPQLSPAAGPSSANPHPSPAADASTGTEVPAEASIRPAGPPSAPANVDMPASPHLPPVAGDGLGSLTAAPLASGDKTASPGSTGAAGGPAAGLLVGREESGSTLPHSKEFDGGGGAVALARSGVVWEPLHREPLRRSRPTLGILPAQAPFVPQATDRQPEDWGEIIVRRMEQEFSRVGGATRYPAMTIAADGAMTPGLAERALDLAARGIDALAVVNVMDLALIARALLARPELQRIPTLAVSWVDTNGPIPQVLYDSRQAGFQAAAHLLDSGYWPLWFVPHAGEAYSLERFAGVQDALASRGHPTTSVTLLDPATADGAARRQGGNAYGEQAGQGLFELWERSRGAEGRHTSRPGVVAARDSIALGIIRILSARELHCGAQYGIAGFDDAPGAREAGLTTLRPPLEEMGAAAARQLLASLDGQALPHQLRLQSHLVVRHSTELRESFVRQE